MIVRELHSTRKDGVKLYKTYSDANLYIRQIETGFIYDAAIDVETSSYTYEETDVEIGNEEQIHQAVEEYITDLGYSLEA